MIHSRVALPEPDYLSRIGEVAYTASSIEWMVLGDLNRLADDLPATITLNHLEPSTTAGIATKLKSGIKEMPEGPTREYLTAAYRALYQAATIRNDVLHARPATHPDGLQRLQRTETTDQRVTGHRFWIDDEWLDSAFEKLNASLGAVSNLRPPLP